MTKVAELREKVLGNYPKIATNEKGIPRIIDIIESVASLISAVTLAERERVFLAKVKETTFVGSEGMTCLAYVIPAYVLDLNLKEA